ncbi:unnamed protein product [Absidia cylindrospora]
MFYTDCIQGLFYMEHQDRKTAKNHPANLIGYGTCDGSLDLEILNWRKYTGKITTYKLFQIRFSLRLVTRNQSNDPLYDKLSFFLKLDLAWKNDESTKDSKYHRLLSIMQRNGCRNILQMIDWCKTSTPSHGSAKRKQSKKQGRYDGDQTVVYRSTGIFCCSSTAAPL